MAALSERTRKIVLKKAALEGRWKMARNAH